MTEKQDDWPEDWQMAAEEILGISREELDESLSEFGVLEISHVNPDGAIIATRRFRYGKDEFPEEVDADAMDN